MVDTTRMTKLLLCSPLVSFLLSGSEGVSLSNGSIKNSSIPSAFAGGFGRARDGATSKKGKIKKGKGKLTEISNPPNTLHDDGRKVDDDSSASLQKLDKWGLPVATIDDIFPPMPPETEITPIESNKEYDLDEILECLKDHIDLHLDRTFDENGVEKISKVMTPTNESRQPMELQLLHKSPPVLAIHNFFTVDECVRMKKIALDDNSGAYQVNSATFSGALSTRTSTSWFCLYKSCSELLAKAHYLLNIPLEAMEEPQVVRYKTGQEFSWHYDEVPAPQLKNGGQRLATLLVYLSDLPNGGGGTVFRDLRHPNGDPLSMQPKLGSALLFFPAFKNGRPDDRTLHKGEVISGEDEKWIIQMWIHETAYKAVLPEGNNQELARDSIESVRIELGLA